MKYKYYKPYYEYVPEEQKLRKGRPRQAQVGADTVLGQLKERYYAWAKHRSQAHFRKEQYLITAEQWHNLWTDELWQRRGRHSDCIVLTRQDPELPWSTDNVEFIARQELLRRNALLRVKNRVE